MVGAWYNNKDHGFLANLHPPMSQIIPFSKSIPYHDFISKALTSFPLIQQPFSMELQSAK